MKKMKKAVHCLIIMAICLGTAAAFLAGEKPLAAAGPPLAIDTEHVYAGMDKSYAEGYLPAVSGGKATVVLPLVSATVDGPITVKVDLGDPSASPFVYKNYEKQFARESHSFDGEAVESYLVQFTFALAEGRVNGSYPVTFTVSGKDAGEEPFTQEFTLYVSIRDGIDPHAPAPEPEPKPEPSSRPRLMVTAYALDRDYLVAGETADLAVTIYNTSDEQKLQNIKLSFIAESGEIVPEGTGAAYCRQIAKGGSYTWRFKVTATPAAESRPHPATILMEYEDSGGQAISASDRIILPVRQPVRLEYEEPALPPRVTQGDTVPFSMNLMNLGKSAIYNALLKFEIPGLASGGSVLVGTIPPGQSQTGTTNFRVDAEGQGPVAGKLVLSYEDEYGEFYEKEIALSTTIEQKIAPVEPAGDDTPASSRRWLINAVAGAAVLALAAFFLMRWLKEKKAREEDEMRL